jgi:hypothetical protein
MDSLAVRHRPIAAPAHRPAQLFLTDRKAPSGTPTLDVCPETGRARLSCRRAEEIFEENTRLLANPLASPKDIEDLDGPGLPTMPHRAQPDQTAFPALACQPGQHAERPFPAVRMPGRVAVVWGWSVYSIESRISSPCATRAAMARLQSAARSRR